MPLNANNSMDNLFKKRVAQTRIQVRSSIYYKNFIHAITDNLEFLNESKISRVISYGLGRVSTAIISMHQAIFCSELAKHFGVGIGAYDPVFDDQDWKFLVDDLNFSPDPEPFPPQNLHGPVVLFMPHCDAPVNKQVIATILANDEIVILFSNIISDKELYQRGDMEWEEIFIPSDLYPRHDVFNNCCINLFYPKLKE
jgi:hypothetical protein